VHAALQFSALPVMISDVQGLSSSQIVGQDEGGSQVSPGSMTPLPHELEQSLSVEGSQPAGQQPSPPVQRVMGRKEQRAEQFAALPVRTSFVQGLESSQIVGQDEGGSHVSPGSMTPLPHEVEQSMSVEGSHPSGQQPSPALHSVMGWSVHTALQLSALPYRTSRVHGSASAHVVGQEEGGSQVSPGSMMPFPQAVSSPSM